MGALRDTAEFLESLEAQTLALMNVGASLDRVIHEVEVPAHLRDKPHLRPIYDHPKFLVRNSWRLYQLTAGQYQVSARIHETASGAFLRSPTSRSRPTPSGPDRPARSAAGAIVDAARRPAARVPRAIGKSPRARGSANP